MSADLTDRALLELAAKAAGPLAAVGVAALREHAAWVERNKTRSRVRSWLETYTKETGEWFVREEAEADDISAHDELRSASKNAQRSLTTARAATRRAIVRAAAEIERAKG